MIRTQTIKQRRPKRVIRMRTKIIGSQKRPRMSVYRSNYALYVQFIDDMKKKTIGTVWVKGKNMASAGELAKKILQKTKEFNITSMVFDRGGNKYHGVIKTLVDLVRNGGIQI